MEEVLTLKLKGPLVKILDDAVEKGGYESRQEVIRQALRVFALHELGPEKYNALIEQYALKPNS